MGQKNVMPHGVHGSLWNWAIPAAKLTYLIFFSIFLKNCFHLTNPFERAIGFLNLIVKITQSQVRFEGFRLLALQSSFQSHAQGYSDFRNLDTRKILF